MMNKKLIRPTDIEEAQITATALTDPDNPPLTDNELLLDQISRYLQCQFLKLPTNLQERVSQVGMGEEIKKTRDGIEEFDWAVLEDGKVLEDLEAKEIEEGEGIRKGKGARPKIKTERYYIWDTLSPLQREYEVARYDFENYPGYREKATSSKLVETITPYLETNFSDLPQQMKMKIAFADNHNQWDKISTEQRKQLAHESDAKMLPNEVNKFHDMYLELNAIPDYIFYWQGLNPNGIASEQIIIDNKIKELKERVVELEELLGYSNSNNEQESKQIRIAPSLNGGTVKGIDKRKIMAAFQGIKWDNKHWSKNLAAPPKWLETCRVLKGSKKTSALWNPVCIGLCLLDKGESLKKLDSVFFRLKDWNDDWREKTELERD